MSSLRDPGLGPIVGHTTESSCRLWIRAGDPGDSGATLASERRTVGVIAVIKKNDRDIADPPVYYFRVHREYDRTGSFDLGNDVGFGQTGEAGEAGERYELEPETKYHVRLGTLTIDDPFSDDEIVVDENLADRLPDPKVWLEDLLGLKARKSEAVFHTFPQPAAQASDKLSFIVGSCRYPGILWKVKHADRIFGPLREQAHTAVGGVPASFVLMVGDQIYADMLHRFFPIGLADTYEEFQDRYREAFGSTNMRKLLRGMPTYMILDDHEIEDNWTQDRMQRSKQRRLFNLAIGAYMSYQWSHGPRTYGDRLYYAFDCGGYPFFVLDMRTQRYIDDVDDSLDDNHMLGRPSLDPSYPNQLQRLLAWLVAQQNDRGNVPKFIVASSVFVPNPMAARKGASVKKMQESDSWPGFPATRKAILQCIVDNDIQNVIFVSGDIHCSNVAQMFFTGTPAAEDIKAFSITSSAFYWPFPFADGEPSDYVHDSRKPGQKDSFAVSDDVTLDYKAWNFTQKDNFGRVDIDRLKAEIKVRAFDSKGKQIVEEKATGGSRRAIATFKLAPW